MSRASQFLSRTMMAHLHYHAHVGRRKPHPRVRVLGLTASIVNCKAEDRDTFARLCQELVNSLQAQIEVCKALSHDPPTFTKVHFKQ